MRFGLVPIFILALGVAGCGASASSPPPAATPTLVGAAAVGVQAVIASTDLAVGPNRFTFGLLKNNVPVSSGNPRLTFFRLHGTSGTAVSSSTAHFSNFTVGLPHTAANANALAIKGVFVTQVNFASAGPWGVQIDSVVAGKPRTLHESFTVAAHSTAPNVGQPAPRSHNPTIRDMPARLLDSGRPPDDMHKLSIAAAIAQHKPLLVLFSTPAFCESRMCGPETEIVERVENQFRGKVNFIHIEVYKNANPADGYAATFLQWHLQTEPWVFIVNRKGIISARFEGPTPVSELDPAIRSDLQA
jgi:hypothetical protein